MTLALLDDEEATALAQAEAVINDGLKKTWAVLTAFDEIASRRLYRATHADFASYCEERWGVTRSQGHRWAAGGRVLAELSAAGVSPVGDIPERQLRELGRLPEGERAEAYTEAVALAQGAPTAEVVRDVVEARRSAFDDPGAVSAWKASAPPSAEPEDLDEEDDWASVLGASTAATAPPAKSGVAVGNAGGEPLQGGAPATKLDDEAYSPEWLADLAREAFGGSIHLDPFSCARAQHFIRAHRYFTKDQNAFVQDWAQPNGEPSNVYFNPPFSLMALAVAELLKRIEAGEVAQVFVVSKHKTDTEWWRLMSGWIRGEPKGRVVFYMLADPETGRDEGWAKSPREATALSFMGDNPRRFAEALARRGGTAMVPASWWMARLDQQEAQP